MKNFTYLLCISSLLVSSYSHAWSQHGLLTRVALSVLPEAVGTAEYRPLESVLPKMGLKYDMTSMGPAVPGKDSAPVVTAHDLNLYLRIKKDSANHQAFEFLPRLGEMPGMQMRVLDVLSHYTDEPDGWKDTHNGDEPDTFLFDEDQYPQLWKPEFEMLGGKEGTASQSFRHMWWGPWSARHPIATFKLPFGQLTKPMGEADERALTYIELSRAAGKAGSRYWQLRFLSNALHYLQDCTQPFHITQTATKKFIWMASPAGGWKGSSTKMSILTKRTTQLVAYYHWSYEDLIGRIFKNPAKYQKAYDQFTEALKKVPVTRKIEDPGLYLTEVAKASIIRAPVAAKTAIKFFPEIPKDKDLTVFDPDAFRNDAFWAEVDLRVQEDSKTQRKYFNSVKESFQLFGESVRSVVKTEIGRTAAM